MQDGYLSVLNLIEPKIAMVLFSVPSETAVKIEEIRLRAERPLSVAFSGKTYFVSAESRLSFSPKGALIVDSAALNQTVKNLCGSSVYSHSEEILNGFISMPKGCRAGIVGTFRQGRFCEVSSVNIRIAREIKGVANEISSTYCGGSWLICGPPGSGKTTYLRDLVRGVSNGEGNRPYKISLIDSRGELAAVVGGVPQADVGVNTDVISGRNKAQAIESALRSMSPEIIAFDEIGSVEEVEAVSSSLRCGAYVFATAHIESPESLFKRNVTRCLIQNGLVDKIVFLSSVGAKPLVMEAQLCGL